MANVAITGAAGRIGTEALRALEGHSLTAIDIDPIADVGGDIDARRLDVTEDTDAMRDAFAGQDVLIHLAAWADPYKEWDAVLDVNIDGTYQVFDAAADADVDRVVFASSNHVTHLHNILDPERPETMVDAPAAVHVDAPYGPDSPYGISKVAGEAIGTFHAVRDGREFVNLRIGWYLSRDELREHQEEPEEVARYARAMFLAPEDCRDVIRRAVEADIPENPLTVNVVSENSERYLSITHTRRALGYDPSVDSADVVDE